MRIFFALLLFFLFAGCGPPDRDCGSSRYLVSARQDGHWGIWDLCAGKWSLPNQYDMLLPFSEGKAAVQRDGKWGFADTSGKELIAPRFEAANSFSGGYAFVRLDGKWGIIDATGNFTVEPVYEEIDILSEGIMAVKANGKWGYCRNDGRVVAEPQFDFAGFFHDGHGIAGYSDGPDQVCCIVDRNGRADWRDSLYRNIFPFDGGLALALTGDFRQAVIDTAGRILFKAPHAGIELSRDGRGNQFVIVLATGGMQYGLLNRRGEFVLDTIYEKIGGVNEGRVAFSLQGKWGVADTSGKIIAKPAFEFIGDFRGGLASARQQDKYGFIDRSGQWTIQPEFDEVYAFSHGLATVREGYTSGVIDSTGKRVIPCRYEFISLAVSHEFFYFTKDKKVGILHRSGEEWLPATFDQFAELGVMQNGTMVLDDQ